MLDRGKVYSASKEGTVPGHQYSWLGRVIAQEQSWFAPRDVERIPTSTTPAAVAAEQVKRLALTLAAGVLPDMDRLLSDYYQLRGWNPDGSPGEERLAELGLA